MPAQAMNQPVVLLVELSGTNLTLVGMVPCVHLHVYLQVVLLVELSGTDFTLVSMVPCVDLHMYLQVAIGR